MKIILAPTNLSRCFDSYESHVGYATRTIFLNDYI